MNDYLSAPCFLIRTGDQKWAIAATVQCLGDDIQIALFGGEKPHIGATALAIPRPGINDPKKVSSTASVLCKTGHKDDELAREAALRIAACRNATVCVTVGIHVDNATSDDIDKLYANFSDAVDRITGLLDEKSMTLIQKAVWTNYGSPQSAPL